MNYRKILVSLFAGFMWFSMIPSHNMAMESPKIEQTSPIITDTSHVPLLGEIILKKILQHIPAQMFNEGIINRVVQVIENNEAYRKIVLDILMPKTLTGHTDWINSVAFSPNGKLLASKSADTIKLWNVKTFQERKTLKNHSWGNSIAFSPDGTLMVSEDVSIVQPWHTKIFEKLNRCNAQHDWFSINAFSPDGSFLASGVNSTIKIWDIKTFKELKILNGHTGWVNSVAFSPNGKLLASGSNDKTIKIWPVISFGINRETPIKQVLFFLYMLQNKDKADWQPTSKQAATLLSLYKELSDKQKSFVSAEMIEKLESIQKMDIS